MIDVVHCGSLQPGGSLHFCAESREIDQRQFKLNHALGPWAARLDAGDFLPTPDTNETVYSETIYRESRSSGCEDQEESGDSQERVSAMENVNVSLVDGGEAKKNQQAVEASQAADGQEDGRSREYPEERRGRSIGLRNDCEQV